MTQITDNLGNFNDNPEILAAMAESMKAQMTGVNPVLENVEEVTPASPPVTPPPVEQPPVEPVKQEPVITEPKTPEPVIAETPKAEQVIVPPVKSFEELLAERSGGKFKSFEEIEQALTPKEEPSEKIKRLWDLEKKGVDVTSKEFLELQSIDFDKMEQSDELLFEKYKRSEEGRGLSDKTIRYEINKKYNVNEWINKNDDELTDDDYANRERMLRDAGMAKEWLINYKNERTLEKAIDPAQQQAMAAQAQKAQQEWERYVDSDLVNKVNKLSIPISYKDETGKVVESNFDYVISEQERKGIADRMKQLTTNPSAFFGQFIDKDGNPNHEAFFKYQLKAEAFDRAVALAASDAAEKRAIAIERQLKNTNFKPAEIIAPEGGPKTIEEAQREAIGKMKLF